MYFADMVMTDRRDITDPRFDRWLSRRLHEAYDGVLREQLPSDLEQLVRKLDPHLTPRAVDGDGGTGGESDDELVSRRSHGALGISLLELCH